MKNARLRSIAGWLALAISMSACSDKSSTNPEQTTGTSYYIDCQSSVQGEGTLDAPWTDFEMANSIVLEPGDRLLLRRGTICNGMLKPMGSGTAEDRIQIAAYGEGALPRIDAQGLQTAAVHLEDMSHVVRWRAYREQPY